MAVSKILIDSYGIDLTTDTVASANDIAIGKVGHLNDGTIATGTFNPTAYAFILATYPAGSVCTATNGTTILTATDTSGSFLFNIPSVGTWTVTSTDGTQTASNSVSITTQGQSESVTLSYALYIIKDGVFQSGYTFSGTTNNYSGYASGYDSSANPPYINAFGAVITGINMTDYSTLYYDTSLGSGAGWNVTSIGDSNVWTDGSGSGQILSTKQTSGYSRITRSFDISSVSGSHLFKAHGWAFQGNPYCIYNLWLA